MSPSESLTSHLASLSASRPYAAATNHPFLTQAGNRSLSKDALSLYLSQDRLYAAHGYVTFLGHLLSKIPFSSHRPFDSPYERFLQRIVKTVDFALQNVVREVNFFNDTASKYGLTIDDWKERKPTRDYLAEMARTGASGTLEDGLVFLWAMERVYYDAWKYVGSLISKNPAVESPTPTQKAVSFLVSNWTNDDFGAFVTDLENIVNHLEIKPGSDAWCRAEAIWSRVVELEEAFWPNVDDEKTELDAHRVIRV